MSKQLEAIEAALAVLEPPDTIFTDAFGSYSVDHRLASNIEAVAIGIRHGSSEKVCVESLESLAKRVNEVVKILREAS